MDVEKMRNEFKEKVKPGLRYPEDIPSSHDVSWSEAGTQEYPINWAGYGDLDVRYQERLFWQRVFMESLMSYHLDKGCAHPGDSELARNDANKAVKAMRETCPLPGSPGNDLTVDETLKKIWPRNEDIALCQKEET